MEEWKEYKLEEVTSILGDGIHGTPKYDDEGNVFFINGNNLENGKIVIKENTKRVSSEEAIKHSRPLSNRTILVSINGTLGNVAKYNGELCILGKSACYFNVNEDVDLDFIYYVVANNQFKDTITRLATGTTIKNVSLKTMREYSFWMPSKETQKRVSAILKSLDDKIEVNRRINEQLEELAGALFKSWFVDFEPFKDGEFVDSELGMIPKGWKVGTLGDITTEQKNKVGNRTDVKVLSPITTGELVLSEDFFTKQVFSKSIAKYLIVKPKDFAYNPARVNIGSLGMNEFEFDGCVSPVYVVFRCNKGYDYFFDLYRNRQSFKDEVLSRSIGGVRQTLSYKDFAMISLVYPPVNIVNTFNETYIKIKNIILHNKQEIHKLSTLRDTLLPKLMSGEIDVNEVEI